jgi:hypothetical protein
MTQEGGVAGVPKKSCPCGSERLFDHRMRTEGMAPPEGEASQENNKVYWLLKSRLWSERNENHFWGLMGCQKSIYEGRSPARKEGDILIILGQSFSYFWSGGIIARERARNSSPRGDISNQRAGIPRFSLIPVRSPKKDHQPGTVQEEGAGETGGLGPLLGSDIG